MQYEVQIKGAIKVLSVQYPNADRSAFVDALRVTWVDDIETTDWADGAARRIVC